MDFWLVVWNMFFPIYWDFHPPNWRTPSFFRGVGLNHQPDLEVADFQTTLFSPSSDWIRCLLVCCSPGIEDMPMFFAMRNKHHWHGSFPICLVMILVASIHDSTGVRWNTSSFLLEWFKSSIRCLLEIFGYNPSMVEPSFSKWKNNIPRFTHFATLDIMFLGEFTL